MSVSLISLISFMSLILCIYILYIYIYIACVYACSFIHCYYVYYNILGMVNIYMCSNKIYNSGANTHTHMHFVMHTCLHNVRYYVSGTVPLSVLSQKIIVLGQLNHTNCTDRQTLGTGSSGRLPGLHACLINANLLLAVLMHLVGVAFGGSLGESGMYNQTQSNNK